MGCSAVFVAKRLSPLAELWCVDTWKPDAGMLEYREVQERISDAFDRFCSNIWSLRLQNIVTPVQGTSLDVPSSVVPDWVYLDGGHDLQSVRTDLEVWWPRLVPGGILLGDDYNMTGVKIAWNEFAGREKVDLTVEDQLVWVRKV